LLDDARLRQRLGWAARKTIEGMPLDNEVGAWMNYLAGIIPSFARLAPSSAPQPGTARRRRAA
jgi:hypothetical protein